MHIINKTHEVEINGLNKVPLNWTYRKNTRFLQTYMRLPLTGQPICPVIGSFSHTFSVEILGQFTTHVQSVTTASMPSYTGNIEHTPTCGRLGAFACEHSFLLFRSVVPWQVGTCEVVLLKRTSAFTHWFVLFTITCTSKYYYRDLYFKKDEKYFQMLRIHILILLSKCDYRINDKC